MNVFRQHPRLAPVLVCAGILVLVAILYWPVLDYPFLALDDPFLVIDNPGIRELSLRTVRFLFLEDQRDSRYYPLAYLSFAIDHALFGLDAGAFHAPTCCSTWPTPRSCSG